MTYSPNFRGKQANASSRQIETNYVNASGGFLPKGSVVSATTGGQMQLIDITSQDSVNRLLGVTSIALSAAATGGVVAAGRVEDVTTSFAVGDALYVNTDGTLTNQKPDYGVLSFAAGHYVIFIGIVVKNEFNLSLKDLQIMPSVVGQL